MTSPYPTPATTGRPATPATEFYTHAGRHRRSASAGGSSPIPAAADLMGIALVTDDAAVPRPDYPVVTWVLATSSSPEPLNALDGDIVSRPSLVPIISNADPYVAGSLSNTNGSNNMLYSRVLEGSGTISALAVEVGTASGNVAASVYSSQGVGRGASPDALLASSGIVACPASGYAQIALDVPVDITPGMWFAFWADNTTATFRNVSGTAMLDNALLAGRAYYETGRTGGPPAEAGVAGPLVPGNRRAVILVGVA